MHQQCNAIHRDFHEQYAIKHPRKEAHPIGLFRRQPNRSRVLAPHHQIDVILRPQTMGHRGQETVRIRRQVHSRHRRLEVEHRADEGRVLMGKPIMFLSSPSGRLDVIDRSNILPPRCFLRLMMPAITFDKKKSIRTHETASPGTYRLYEFAILDHHRMDDAQEGFITRKQPGPTRQRVTLQHTLASVFRQDLDDSSALVARGDVPLEVTPTVLQ